MESIILGDPTDILDTVGTVGSYEKNPKTQRVNSMVRPKMGSEIRLPHSNVLKN